MNHFLFQGTNIQIKGTNEEPLFRCLDIVKILGCRESNDNWFYQKNKSNADFIKTLSITEGNHSDVKSERFFTETGLYECLFASESLIAKIFRREIIQLLKNIRLGVIGL